MSKAKEYICPNCRAKVTSRVPLTYCACGGKYAPTIEDAIKNLDIFGDIFGDILKGKPNGSNPKT